MEQLYIETGKGTLTVADVTNYDGCIETFCAINGYTFPIHLQGITEEQAKEVVDESIHTGLFAHYVHGINPPNLYHYKNAIPSLLSLLEANGVTFKNTLGDMPSSKSESYVFEYHPELEGNPTEVDYEKYWKDLDEWEEAQSKVWNKENTYLFRKI